MWRVTHLHIKTEEWLLSTANLNSDSECDEWLLPTSNDSSPHQMWRDTPLHIKCEEWFLSTSNVKSGSSPHQMWRQTPPLKCEEWLLSTLNVKSVTPLHMRATPLHTICEWWLLSKCEEWLLHIIREKWLPSIWNVKSDSRLGYVLINWVTGSWKKQLRIGLDWPLVNFDFLTVMQIN
jgi:hypothetical protein